MAETVVLALVIGAFIGYVALSVKVLPVVLWQLRDMRGMGTDFVYALAFAYGWMILYLGSLIVNRFVWRVPFPSWYLLLLAVTLFAQPWVLLIRFLRWKRGDDA